MISIWEKNKIEYKVGKISKNNKTEKKEKEIL